MMKHHPGLRPQAVLIACLAALSSLANAADEILIHVAPDGNDAWSGRFARPAADRSDGPLATLAGARDALRKLRAQAPPDRPLRVRFAEGIYSLTGPVEFGPADSGTAAAPVVYEAAPGTKPVITGGRPVTGWQPGPDGIWNTTVPEVKAGSWYFEQLWINGRRATRARSPNRFYHHMLRKVERGIDPLTGRETDLSSRAIAGRGDDLAAIYLLPKESLADVTAVVYHSWEMSRHRIAAADKANNQLIATAGAPWPFFKWGADQRYHLENFRAALDAPGEWFLARDGTLSYIPLPGEDMTRARVIAPVAGQFVRCASNTPVTSCRLTAMATPRPRTASRRSSSPIPPETSPSRIAGSPTPASMACGSGARASIAASSARTFRISGRVVLGSARVGTMKTRPRPTAPAAASWTTTSSSPAATSSPEPSACGSATAPTTR